VKRLLRGPGSGGDDSSVREEGRGGGGVREGREREMREGRSGRVWWGREMKERIKV